MWFVTMSCKNEDSGSAHEFNILHSPRSVCILKRRSKASVTMISVENCLTNYIILSVFTESVKK